MYKEVSSKFRKFIKEKDTRGAQNNFLVNIHLRTGCFCNPGACQPHLGLVRRLDDDIMSQLKQESSDLEVEPSCFALEGTINGDNYNEGVLIQHMDIREPLSILRNLLEQRLGFELSDYSFWLQDTQMLENHKNLADQCVQGEGLVQVNVQIKQPQKRINIVDVLKPVEDYINLAESSPSTPNPEENKNVIRWMVDAQYKKDQERLKIPADKKGWTQTHVKHWLKWAVRQFNLVSLKLTNWNITGAQLCNLTLEEFKAKLKFCKNGIL